jgi:hypothetical protein
MLAFVQAPTWRCTPTTTKHSPDKSTVIDGTRTLKSFFRSKGYECCPGLENFVFSVHSLSHFKKFNFTFAYTLLLLFRVYEPARHGMRAQQHEFFFFEIQLKRQISPLSHQANLLLVVVAEVYVYYMNVRISRSTWDNALLGAEEVFKMQDKVPSKRIQIRPFACLQLWQEHNSESVVVHRAPAHIVLNNRFQLFFTEPKAHHKEATYNESVQPAREFAKHFTGVANLPFLVIRYAEVSHPTLPTHKKTSLGLIRTICVIRSR